MFTVGELVVYGGEGVCRIENIGPSTIPGADKDRLYYYLTPMGRSGQALTPVDTKVLMRPVMAKDEALALIAQLQTMEPEKAPQPGMRAAKEFYHSVVTSYDCLRMARMIKAICHKRAWALEHGKKVSQMDERYLKRAEEQLYSELAVAIGEKKENMADYIRQVYPDWLNE